MNKRQITTWIRQKARLLIGTGCALALLVGAYLWWSLSGQAMLAATVDASTSEPIDDALRVVRTASVESSGQRKGKTYPGTVHAKTTAQMAFRVGGPLIEVNINPGDEVKRGQVLMRIDPRDFENRVAAAKAALSSAKARQAAMNSGARSEDIQMLNAKRSALDARQASLKAEFDRNARLIVENAVSRSEYETSEAALKAINNEILAADEELKKAKAGARKEDRQSMAAEIEALEVQLKTAQDQLDDTVMRAPFDGTVSKQLVENFEPVVPGQEVLVIHDISKLEIRVALPEKDVIRRTFNDSFHAKVRLLACPETELVAAFKELDTEADLSTRTYQVTFELEPTSQVNVFPGMVAEVEIGDSHTQSLAETTVPTQAVLGDDSDDQFVWIVKDSQVRKQSVRLGELIGTNRQVVHNGLNEGDTVVVAGGSFLSEGEEVTTYASKK